MHSVPYRGLLAACSVLGLGAQAQTYRLLNHSLGGLSGAFLFATTSTTFLLAPGCCSASTNTSATCAHCSSATSLQLEESKCSSDTSNAGSAH